MITIKNSNGLCAKFNKKGASLEELFYGKQKVATKGITVGRYANRISNSRFSLNGSMYQLAANEGVNCLHGGLNGLSKREWKADLLDIFEMITNDESDACGVRFSITSVDGDQGFPGNLRLSVTYYLSDDNELIIRYKALSDKDTYVNFTNHAYFNMNGCGSVHDQKLWVDTDSYVEVDDKLIPTGRILKTKGTNFDLIEGNVYKGDLDLNFVLNGTGFRHVAELEGLKSKLALSVFTDQPGLQIYNTPEEICLETQHYPDSPNNPTFPSTLLKAGEIFNSTTVYKFHSNRK